MRPQQSCASQAGTAFNLGRSPSPRSRTLLMCRNGVGVVRQLARIAVDIGQTDEHRSTVGRVPPSAVGRV